ncbi:MAG: porin [Chromatiales bacterium]|jgi:predicted porin|nr:porin [Chromatiales bacterium]MDX9766930.1 porin [Ectothiorhodospiraceae bacterium]
MHIDSPARSIAHAIAGAIAGTAFLAATAVADTQIYGVAHVSLDHVDNGDSSGHQLSSNSSRIGFKGSEDLGNGLTALWQIESAANLTGGASASTGFAGRNSYVGLRGGFGTALFGRHDTPYKMSTGRLDVFGDKLADYNAIVGSADDCPASLDAINGIAYVETCAVFDNRTNNTLAWLSPSFGGLSVALAYVTDVAANGDRPGPTSNDGRAYSLSLSYEAGPLYLTLAHERIDNAAISYDFDGIVFIPNIQDISATKAGGSYTFGATTLNALVEHLDSGIDKRTGWYLGGRHSLGSSYVAAAAGQSGERDAFDDSNATFMAIGAGHHFSKRTEVYALWVQVDNQDNAGYGIGFAGHGKPVDAWDWGNTVRGLSAGVVHRF